MKNRLFALSAKLVEKVASLSVGTLCLVIFHQPKVPVRLIHR
jgi:cyclic lactone autoinducer peptide